VVHVTVRRDGRGRLSSLSAEGHTEWAEHGRDVVCAAVSALLQAAWLGLQEVANVDVDGKRTEGRLVLRWPEAARDDRATQAIVATMEAAVAHLAAQYPDHVRLTRETESRAP
jgi:uncharacterized protein